MSAKDFNNSFYKIISSEMVTDKGVMAMPLYYDALAFYINQDIFTRAAIVPPETWIELEDLADDFTQRDNNKLIIQSSVAMGDIQNVDYWQEILALLLYQNGVNPANPGGDRLTSVFDFYNDFQKQKVWDTRLPSSTDFFAQGNLAMYFAPTIEASYIIQKNPDLRFRTVPLPQIPKGSPSDPDYSYTSYYANGVAAGSGDRENAWKLLKYLTVKENLIKLNELRENSGLYPRIYPRPSMANLQNADPILGSVVALIPQAKGWYLNDDRVEGDTSITDQISNIYSISLAKGQRLQDLTSSLKKVLSKYGIRVN
jgi:ABC-type glycerol-3-phosphate transport system substrate-binding protein